MVTNVILIIQTVAILLLVAFTWRTLRVSAPIGRTAAGPLSQQSIQHVSRVQVVIPSLNLSRLWTAPPASLTKLLAYGAFLLVSLLYASFSMVAKDSLERIDAIIFTALQMALLVPFACFFLLKWRRLLTQQILIHGALLGGCLSAALLCLTWSFKSTGITETTIFMSLNGLIATCIAVFVFRQSLSRYTWIACGCSFAGILLIWSVSHQGWQGNFTAFVGGSLMTIFAFLVERLFVPQVKLQPKVMWPIFGVLLLTMAGASLVLAFCFGNWQTLRLLQSHDILVLLYTSVGTTLVPLILTAKAQRHVNAVTVAFLAILEPLTAASFAFLTGERLSTLAYIGGFIILIAVVLQALAGTIPNKQRPASLPATAPVTQASSSLLRIVKRPTKPALGKRARILIDLLARAHDGADLYLLQRWTGASLPDLHHQLQLLQRKGYVVRDAEQRRYLLHSAYLPHSGIRQKVTPIFASMEVGNEKSGDHLSAAPVFYRVEVGKATPCA
jgi:drug/metabolite transporter (DMT)-like permease